MAIVTRIAVVSKERTKRHPTTTECEATSFVDKQSGEKLLQLTSFGSPERKETGKGSQTLQFDHETARQLVAIVKQAFSEI